ESVSFKIKIRILGKLPPCIEVALNAVLVSFSRSISPILSGVQVVIKVPHRNAKLADVIGGLFRDLSDQTIKLLFGFPEMKENCFVIHKYKTPNKAYTELLD